jgi:hypothetical protein
MGYAVAGTSKRHLMPECFKKRVSKVDDSSWPHAKTQRRQGLFYFLSLILCGLAALREQQ